MQKLFSYGTLQLESVQIETFSRKLTGVKDTLIGYILSEVVITDEVVIKASETNIHPILRYTGNSSDEVPGTVFEITQEELLQADEYEVDDYQRISAEMKSGETVWIYAAAE